MAISFFQKYDGGSAIRSIDMLVAVQYECRLLALAAGEADGSSPTRPQISRTSNTPLERIHISERKPTFGADFLCSF